VNGAPAIVKQAPLTISSPVAIKRREASMPAKVLLLNDETTTMEFVVDVLEDVFGKTRDEAIKLMLEIHRDGSGICGIYEPDRARAVAEEVAELARCNNQPLRCVVEPVQTP
jgi:ATP-dependent Clp protease adaptor protein ClpS